MNRPQAGALELIMSHEQRKFTRPNSDNRGGSPQYAYELERQAGVIQQAQRSGRLFSKRFDLERIEQKDEAGQKWYVLQPRGNVLFSGDCDEEILSKLVLKKNVLTIIWGIERRPDVTFGRQEQVIAAVLTKDNRVAYKSPGFDLEAYMQGQSLNKEEKKDKK